MVEVPIWCVEKSAIFSFWSIFLLTSVSSSNVSLCMGSSFIAIFRFDNSASRKAFFLFFLSYVFQWI